MENYSQLSILRTDIKTKKKLKLVQPIFNNHSKIKEWSVDIEDIDNVLRIEHEKDLNESHIILLLREAGFYSEALTD